MSIYYYTNIALYSFFTITSFNFASFIIKYIMILFYGIFGSFILDFALFSISYILIFELTRVFLISI